MARGRMINRELMTSEKFGKLSWVARAMYAPTYACANRDGHLPGEVRACWAETKASALLDLEEFAGVVREFLEVDLWRARTTTDGRPFFEIAGFRENQAGSWRYDREPESEWAEPCRQSGDTLAANLRQGDGTASRQVEGEGECKGKGKAAPSIEDRTDERGAWSYHIERSRILRACQELAEESGRPWAPNIAAEDAIRRLADDGRCRIYPDLPAELRRVREGARRKGLRQAADVSWLLRNLGSAWDAPAKQGELTLGPVGLIEGHRRREELEEIAAEETDEGRARVARHLEEFRKKRNAPRAPGRTISPDPGSWAGPEADRRPGPLAQAVGETMARLEARK